MRVALCIALVISVLNAVQGQTTPTTTPEDYRLTFRKPNGCAPSECEFFAGIQTNEGDPTFLDIYLEGSAQGWVAIGVSETPSMFSADVLGCNVLQGSAMVVAVDTWNLDLPSRFNTIDSTQDGLVQHNSSFVGGRITCSFSRSISALDPGQDLDLDGDYFVLYGASNNPAPSASSGLAVHGFGVGRIPAVSLQRRNLATDADPTSTPGPTPDPIPPPTTTPEDYRLTFRNPTGCAPSECEFFAGIQTNKGDSSFLDFYLEGSAQGWVAIGVSETQNMFSADVLGCNVLQGSAMVVAVDTWNLEAARLNIIDSTQDGLVQHNSSFVGGRITCSFSRSISALDPGQDLDLDGDYFVLYGASNNPAPSASSGLAAHGFGVGRIPAVSLQRINLVTTAVPTPGPTFPPTPDDCPNPVECLVDPCRDAECLRFPTARCIPDFCHGECKATFVRGQRNNDVTARCGNRTACQIKECPSRRICVEELMPPVCPDDMPDCMQTTRARCVLPPRPPPPTSCEEVMCEVGMVCRFRARSGRRPVIRCVPAP